MAEEVSTYSKKAVFCQIYFGKWTEIDAQPQKKSDSLGFYNPYEVKPQWEAHRASVGSYGFLHQSHQREDRLNKLNYSFVQMEPSTQVAALTTDGEVITPLNYTGASYDTSYLNNAIKEFGESPSIHDFSYAVYSKELALLKQTFPCPEDEVLNRPGMQESCIFTTERVRFKETNTQVQMMIQCMGLYPLKSWIIFKKLTINEGNYDKENVVNKPYVKETWTFQICTAKGWSKNIEVRDGKKVSASKLYRNYGGIYIDRNWCFI